MIDIENIVVDEVKTALSALTEYPTLLVGSMYIDAPPSFPYVSVIEDNNYTYEPSHVDLQEDHAIVSYTVDVYANDTHLKQTAKKIANAVDTAMQNMKFTRTMYGQTPDVDRTIYRMTMRYEAIVAKGETINNVLTYQMYHTDRS